MHARRFLFSCWSLRSAAQKNGPSEGGNVRNSRSPIRHLPSMAHLVLGPMRPLCFWIVVHFPASLVSGSSVTPLIEPARKKPELVGRSGSGTWLRTGGRPELPAVRDSHFSPPRRHWYSVLSLYGRQKRSMMQPRFVPSYPSVGPSRVASQVTDKQKLGLYWKRPVGVFR